MKRIVFVSCTFIMCIAMMFLVFATESSEIISWTVEDGVLAISGSGEMDDFAFGDSMAPWYDEKENVTKIVIEEGITSIGQYAFYSFTNVTEVSLPTSLLTIGDAAFWNCNSIEAFHIPKNVNSIHHQALANCTKIAAFSVDGSNEYFATVDGVLFNKDVTKLVYYAGGCGVENYAVPETVTEICPNAFDSCGVLASITLPNGLKTIGSSAFAGCFRLESITIPSGVARIEDYSFEMCSSLKSVAFSDNITYIGKEAFLNCTMLESITLPASIKEIDSGAFNYCSGFTTVNIPASLETINSNAFGACSKLTAFTVDDENTHFAADNGILFSADKTRLVAFPAGNDITDYVVPESVTFIGDGTFSECKKLVSVNTANVEKIEARAFSACTSLEKAELSAAVSSIGDIAFYRCTSLKDFTVYALDTEFALSPFEMCSDELVISCIKGSSFEEIAKENNITYKYIDNDTIEKDVNGDGKVSIEDVLVVLSGVLNGEYSTEADLNGDGKLSLIDVLKVLKAVTA